MSFAGEDEGAGVGFATARGRDWPSVRQFNVFLANRLGAMLNVVRRFETTDIRIIALTVVDSTDCAIVRLVVSDPERAYEIFEQGKLPFTESDLLVVTLPDGPQPLVKICKALLQAEISIHYAYPLVAGHGDQAGLAIHVEDIETASQHLQQAGFTLLSENDLNEGSM
ncbi:MAG: acetolactate synthase [Planctomycetes bacterium]|nr:acetolactate synthase [Planctomycetota bacterium]